MTDSPGKRTVTIPTSDYVRFQELAADQGVSLSSWMLDAARKKRARQAAETFAAAMQDPGLRAELDTARQALAPSRAHRQRSIAELQTQGDAA